MFEKTNLNELNNYLKKNPNLQRLELILPDLLGILRGKTIIGKKYIEAFFKDGIKLPRSIYVFDAVGRVCDNLPYAVEDGDPDFAVFGHLGTLVKLSDNDKYAQIICFMDSLQNNYLQLDSRQVLNNVLKNFDKQKLIPKMGIELEFYLLKQAKKTLNSSKSPASGHYTPLFLFEHANTVESLALLEDFFDELVTKAAQNNIKIQALIKETGAGQFEVTFEPNENIVKACDEVVLVKKMIKNLAAKINLTACFMAKPFSNFSGSGMHFHTSLIDQKTKKNVFYGNKLPVLGTACSNSMLYAIDGMLKMIDESMAIFAPNANSYRRFKTDSFAPTFKNWSANNRTVAIRLPLANKSAARIEHRLAGADANPYLCAAAILLATDKGLELKKLPQTFAKGNSYLDKNSKKIPKNWDAALNKFAKSKNIPKYMGEEFHKAYYGNRQFEADSFNYEVEKKDFDWYLHML